MKNRDAFVRLFTLNEGRRNVAYKDSLGLGTIGVGHLLSEPISDAAVDAILDGDIEKHLADLRKNCPWFDDLDEVRQAALLDLCMNLGWTRLSAFKIALGALQNGVWEAAAIALMNSKWATQVGARATRIIEMVRTGLWPAEIA